MTGRVIIITGANSGIGYRAAEQLCEAGNDVILACRSEEKAKAAMDKIFKRSPNALATYMQCDLADLASVRKFVEEFHATGKKLHMLVNNAGVFLSKDSKRLFSANNFELTMGTNHLGPFLLTHLLLDDLKKSAEAGGDCRIINVTSSMHDPAVQPKSSGRREELDMENFFLEKEGTYNSMQGYKNSKLAMILTTYELARRLKDSGVVVNTVDPGFIPTTGLTRHAGGGTRFFMRYVVGTMLRPIAKPVRTLDQGGKAVIDLVTNEELKGVTGKYFKDLAEATSSEESQKEELQTSVYELSARYCHLEGYEPLDAPVPPPEEPKMTPKKSKKSKKAAAAEETAGPSGEGTTDEGTKDAADNADDEIKFADEEDKPEAATGEKKDDTDAKDSEKVEVVKDSGKEEEVKDSGKEEEVKDSGKEEEAKDSGKDEEVKDSGKEDEKEVSKETEDAKTEESDKLEEKLGVEEKVVESTPAPVEIAVA